MTVGVLAFYLNSEQSGVLSNRIFFIATVLVITPGNQPTPRIRRADTGLSDLVTRVDPFFDRSAAKSGCGEAWTAVLRARGDIAVGSS